jgi:hypothetical protein
VEKICKHCSELKPIRDYRDNRPKCKSCENKIRYIQKQERRKNDPIYDKELKEYDVMRKRKKEREDSLTKFIQIMRQSVRQSFKRKGYTKKSRTYIILGDDWDIVKKYFESLFVEGMNWDNYGEWEIDHITPISTSCCEDEVMKLCHYTNLQPLWKKDNRLKSNKIQNN